MKEINLKTETKKIPSDRSFSIEDMEKMFGKRIKKAILNQIKTIEFIKQKELLRKKWQKFANLGNFGIVIFVKHIKIMLEI